MSQTLEIRIIEGALKIISDPKRHTKRNLAEAADGTMCSPCDDKAVTFCAEGALMRGAYDLDEYGARHDAYYAVRAVDSDYVNVNDGPDGRRRVIAIFKKALKNLRA